MPEFTKCPYCGLSEFSSRSARDNHVYKCKCKSQSISHSDPLSNSSSQPERKPPEYFTRFDGRKAPLTEAELLNEGIDWLKSKFGKKSSPQPDEPVRPPTVTDLAVQRARELNNEIPSQFEAYTPPSYEQHTQTQVQPEQISSRPQFNLGESIRSAVSKFLPQKKQPEFPQRPVNEYGQPMAHWKCYSCWDWVQDTQIALHQIEGHSIERVW